MRHGFFVRLFFTSLLNLLVVILGLFILLSFFMQNSLYDELRKQDNEILFQIQKRMDDDIVAMHRTALSITMDSGFTPFDLPDDPWKAILAIRDLRNYGLISENISLIGIAYTKSEYILSDKGSLTKNFFPVFSLPAFYELSNPENLEKGFIITDDAVVFIFPYPNRVDAEIQGVLFIQYPKEAFYGAFLQSLSGNHRFLTIWNAAGNTVLISSDPVSAKEMIRNEYISPKTGYHYEISTPRSYYTAILNRFRLQLLLSAIGLFALGLLLNLLIARYNVLPLRKLVGKFGHPDSTVDFKAIETVLTEQRSVQERTARDAILLKLIQGAFPFMADLQNASREAELDFSQGFFAFIIVHADIRTDKALRSSLDKVIMEKAVFYRQYQRAGENEIWVYSGPGGGLTEETFGVFRKTAYPGEAPITVAASTISSDTAAAGRYFLEALTALNHQTLPAQGEPDKGLVNIIKHYVEIHFDDHMMGLESIAEFLGFSVGYLSRQFKQKTGTTVAAYIQDLRIREACRLLQSTGLPIKDVVAKVGYMDHSSFSRSFKSQMGISPQNYRTRHLN